MDDVERYLRQSQGLPVPREYPEGRIDGNDEGALAIAIAIDRRHKVIKIDFTKEVGMLAFGATQARDIANHLLKLADELDPPTPAPEKPT